MKLMGQTDYPISVSVPSCKSDVKWNLGKCIVVSNLGCPILVGEPGKSMNHILTDPVKKMISTKNVQDQILSFPYADFNKHNKSSPNNFICRLNESSLISPDENIELVVPNHYTEAQRLFYTPRHQPRGPSLPHQVCTVHNNKVILKNNSDSSILLKKHFHFGDLTPSSLATPMKSDSYVSNLKLSNECSKQQNDLSKISIDPDNILTQEWKGMFNNLVIEYSDTVSSLPGKYNGYYGNVDCHVNFIKDPPSSIKARLPSYSQDIIVTMAKLIDDVHGTHGSSCRA